MGIFFNFSDDPECNWCGNELHLCTCGIKKDATVEKPTDVLYDWVINYNPYAKKWRAAKREHYHLLFSSSRAKEVLSADTMDDLIKQINKQK
jgi:hypothetical protein